MKSFMSLRNTVIAIGIVAMIAALTFTIKVIAAEWGGQITSTETIQLSPASCLPGVSVGSGDCLGTPTCDTATHPCGCDNN